MTACVCSIRIRMESQESYQSTMLTVHRINYKEIVEVFFQSYLKTFQQHWNNLFEHRFADSGYVFCTIFFMTRSTTYFSSTVFVISRFVFFLIQRQSSEDVLWRSYFCRTPRKTSVKESFFTKAASL